LDAVGYNPRVRLASGELSAGDFKGLIQGSRYLIGERMHACIAGLSTAVPTIALGYSVKAQGIMEDLLGSKVSDDGLHLPVAADGLAREIDAITRNNAGIRQRLAEAAVQAKRLADANFVAMREALHGHVRAAA